LITLGKAIAGGLPLSVIGGRKEVMSVIGPGLTAHGGTFNANPLSIRVSLVTLKEVLTEQALHKISTLSEKLQKGYEDIAEDLDVDLSVARWGPSGMIYFSKEVPKNYKEFMKTDFQTWSSYFYYMLHRGVLPMASFNEQWTISIAHTEDEIVDHIEKAEEAIKIARDKKLNLGVFEAF